MATNKNTSKAKTKTARAAKITKKTVTSKPASKITITKKGISLDRLNLLSVIIFSVLAAAAVALMSAATYVVTINYQTFDALAAQAPAIIPAYRHFFDVELRSLLAFILLLSAVLPLLRLTRRKSDYQQDLKNKTVPSRWVEHGVIGGLVVGVAALLVGYQDLVTILLFATGVLIVNLLHSNAEREFLSNKVTALKLHRLAVVSAVLLIIYLGVSLLATPIYGQVRASWYVYAAFVTVALTLVLNGINQSRYLREQNGWQNYEVVERNFLKIAIVSKVALAAVLIAGLAK